MGYRGVRRQSVRPLSISAPKCWDRRASANAGNPRWIESSGRLRRVLIARTHWRLCVDGPLQRYPRFGEQAGLRHTLVP
jgi:hypothetical protein